MTVLHNGVIMKATHVHEDFHLTCTVLVKCANLLSQSPSLSSEWRGIAVWIVMLCCFSVRSAQCSLEFPCNSSIFSS